MHAAPTPPATCRRRGVATARSLHSRGRAHTRNGQLAHLDAQVEEEERHDRAGRVTGQSGLRESAGESPARGRGPKPKMEG